jgi:hypothetical protein
LAVIPHKFRPLVRTPFVAEQRAPMRMMPRGPKPPKSSGVAPAALAAPATITQAPTWAPSWATSNTPTNVKSPSTTKKGTSSPKTRVREASEESEYEYVYSDVEAPRVPADAPLDMPAGFPGEKPVRVVTPQGKADSAAQGKADAAGQGERPSKSGSADSTYVAPSWAFGAAALQPSHHEGVAKAAAAAGAESQYEYYSYDEEDNDETPGRAAFPLPPGHTPSTGPRSPGRARLDNARELYDSAASSSTGAALAKPSFWNQVATPRPPASPSTAGLLPLPAPLCHDLDSDTTSPRPAGVRRFSHAPRLGRRVRRDDGRMIIGRVASRDGRSEE